MTTQFPCRFGKYLLLERISTGGMAEVFRAKGFGVAGFEKSFALKRILPHISEDPEFIAMFIDEAKIAARLHHANICQIVEFGRVGDYYFQVMEYVPGCDLRKIRRDFQARGRTVPPDMVLQAVEKVCDGLDYAHRKTDIQGRPMGIIHRDVSPQNILLSFEGAVKLIDFGIAKAATRAAKTQAGQIKGKFSYLSPEQITGQELDGRVDIFALGIVAWELLTGHDLFVADSEMEILRMILRANVPPPSRVNPSLPPELDHLILQALAVNADDRYQSAEDLLEDLQRVSYKLNLRSGSIGLQRFMRKEFAQELAVEEEKVRRFWDMSKETRLPESEEPVEAARQQSVVTFSGRRLRARQERPPGTENGKHITVLQGVDSDDSYTATASDGARLAAARSPAAGDDIMELSDDDIEELLDEETAQPHTALRPEIEHEPLDQIEGYDWPDQGHDIYPEEGQQIGSDAWPDARHQGEGYGDPHLAEEGNWAAQSQDYPYDQAQSLEEQDYPYDQAQPVEEQNYPYDQAQPAEEQPYPFDEAQPADAQDYPYDQAQPVDEQLYPYDQAQPVEEQNYPYDQAQPVEEQPYPFDEAQPADAQDYLYPESVTPEEVGWQKDEAEQWDMDDASAWEDDETMASERQQDPDQIDSEELSEADLQPFAVEDEPSAAPRDDRGWEAETRAGKIGAGKGQSEQEDEEATVYEGALGPLSPVYTSPTESDPSFREAIHDDEAPEEDSDEGATVYEGELGPLTPVGEDYPGPVEGDEDWVITFNPQDTSTSPDES